MTPEQFAALEGWIDAKLSVERELRINSQGLASYAQERMLWEVEAREKARKLLVDDAIKQLRETK